VFRGAGGTDLMCGCQSVLIEGYVPGNFVAIRIQCFRCGAITSTPALPEGEILPISVVAVPAAQTPMPATSAVPPGAVFACQDAVTQHDALTRPRNLPDEPFLLSRAMLEAAADDYDRLTGGRLAEHCTASPPALGTDHGPYPFAWATLRLREQIDRPGWSWRYQDDDAMAAMYITALHQLMLCWGRHPLLARLAAPLARRDRFIRTVTGFATAKLLHDAGNHLGFSLAGGDVDLHFRTAAAEPLSLVLLAPEAMQWRQRERRSLSVLTSAVVDALASAQGQVNRTRPGVVVLAVSVLQPDFDQMVVDAIHAAFRTVRRRHRGVAAVAVVMPKVLPVGTPDQVGFGYAFYPIRNPRFVGANPVRLEPRR
jgi:hypothetical protein